MKIKVLKIKLYLKKVEVIINIEIESNLKFILLLFVKLKIIFNIYIQNQSSSYCTIMTP